MSVFTDLKILSMTASSFFLCSVAYTRRATRRVPTRLAENAIRGQTSMQVSTLPASERRLDAPRPPDPSVVEFDLHGLVGIRLVGARPADEAGVRRQLGLAPTTLGREPDLVVRFVDRIPVRGDVRLLGLDDAAFTDDAFLVLRGRHKRRVRVRIPLEDLGERCELVCEHGAGSVPLLVAAVNTRALAAGALPLHASAFIHEGTGAVVTGWTKGGKTEALLAFAARGARYVADEWTYVLPPGERVVGIPEPIRLWDWHLRQLPEYAAVLPPRERRRLRALRAFAAAEGRLSRRAGLSAL